jgi:hypothetical protein
MPTPTDRILSEAVAAALERELAARGLLLDEDAFAAAEAEVAEEGAWLLAEAARRCVPALRDGPAVRVAFADDDTAARLAAALAFGAVSARVLAPPGRRPAAEVELLCAIFNVALGLVDDICDHDAETGGLLLGLVGAAGPAGGHERGWLRSAVPPALRRDHTVAFAVEVLEVLFEALDGVDGRDAVAARLEAALDAERCTLGDAAGAGASRGSSVLPFEIIETLAEGAPASGGTSRGTRLGEAMWRIDDLVDLLDDAASGAPNGLLLEAGTLERVVESGLIGRTAARAAADLEAALRPAGDDRAVRSFLFFVQRYAGLAPRRQSRTAGSASPASITSSSAASSTGRSPTGGM